MRLEAVAALLHREFISTERSPWEVLALLILASTASIPTALSRVEERVATILVLLFITLFTSTQSYLRDKWRGVVEVYHIYPIPPAATYAVKLAYTATLMALAIAAYALALATLKSEPGIVVGVVSTAAPPLIYLAAAASLASMIAVHLKSETPLLIAMTTVLSTPILVTTATAQNSILIILSGVSYAIIASIIAELID
ncbi:MAG: hypothetical protein P3X22_002570 [Thermoprotei archaeon]|nr:hypothetical protein [Thermoprotei archaeon]